MKKKYLLNIFLIFFSLGIFLILAELAVLGLQKYGFMEEITFQTLYPRKKQENYNAKLIPSKNPILFMEHDVNHKRINSYGFRGKEIQIQKSENTYRIVAIGDSVTYGLGVKTNQTFSALLEKKLNEKNNLQHYEVINLGVSGYNTEAEVEVIKTKALALQPDMIILSYVLNDVMPVSMMVETVAAAQKQMIFFKKLISETQFGAFVYVKWQKLKQKHSADKVYNFFYSNEEGWGKVVSAFEELKEIREQHSFELLAVIYPLLVPFNDYPFQPQHQKIKTAMFDNDFEVIDLFDEFSKYDVEQFKLADSDKTHPNAFGHRIVSDVLFNWVVSKSKQPESKASSAEQSAEQ